MDKMNRCFVLKDNYDKKDYKGSLCDYCKYCKILDYEVEEVENIFGEYEEKVIPVRYCNYYNDCVEIVENQFT